MNKQNKLSKQNLIYLTIKNRFKNTNITSDNKARKQMLIEHLCRKQREHKLIF